RRVDRLKSLNCSSSSSAAMALLKTDCGTSSAPAAAVNDLVSTARQKNLIARNLSIQDLPGGAGCRSQFGTNRMTASIGPGDPGQERSRPETLRLPSACRNPAQVKCRIAINPRQGISDKEGVSGRTRSRVTTDGRHDRAGSTREEVAPLSSNR